ncbi:hypothetical protein F183_A45370 [Bryobacterales bacterium F-183]|nr:hypothetical protein F183_A45370 [Bryobacterales bacterium F-183]
MKATWSGSLWSTNASAVSRRTALLACCTKALHAANATNVDRIEYDPATSTLRDRAWTGGADQPVLPGSLVKPFTALAYERTHQRFPTVNCKGCWGGKVHGAVNLPRALALSCNRYFEKLSQRVDPRQMQLVCAEYGLPEAPDIIDARLGLGRSWRIPPAALLQAYLRVTAQHPAIKEGMRLCATQGTARAIGKGLAKTGTAPCEHSKPMPGDGLAIWLWPEDQPRRVILVREHGVPGAIAAKRILT